MRRCTLRPRNFSVPFAAGTMCMKRTLRHQSRALSTVTAIFMLLLMFVSMTVIVIGANNYGASVQQQTKTEKERAQEQIAIIQVGLGGGGEINNVTVANVGQIEVKIRALYREETDNTSFLLDPSAYIAPNRNQTFNVASLGLIVDIDGSSKFVAATERGVRSKGVNELSIQREQLPTGVDTSALTIGPLMLTFNSLGWARVDSAGNVQGDWLETWTIPTGYCAWRLNLTNLDDKNRSLTINQYSGFTTSLVSSPVTTTWYLKATEHTVEWNNTITVTFLWGPSRTTPVNANSNSRGLNNVFLTLFGKFSDGETYAQTIPFEAITIV